MQSDEAKFKYPFIYQITGRTFGTDIDTEREGTRLYSMRVKAVKRMTQSSYPKTVGCWRT